MRHSWPAPTGEVGHTCCCRWRLHCSPNQHSWSGTVTFIKSEVHPVAVYNQPHQPNGPLVRLRCPGELPPGQRVASNWRRSLSTAWI